MMDYNAFSKGSNYTFEFTDILAWKTALLQVKSDGFFSQFT